MSGGSLSQNSAVVGYSGPSAREAPAPATTTIMPSLLGGGVRRYQPLGTPCLPPPRDSGYLHGRRLNHRVHRPHVQPLVGMHEGVSRLRELLRGETIRSLWLRRVGAGREAPDFRKRALE